MPERFDVVFLGGGSGGYVAAIRAGQLGLRTAVVEAEKVGGTCLHRGCIPTKALLQSTALLDQVRDGHRLGVNTGEVSFDYGIAAARRDDVVASLYKGVQGLLRKAKSTVVQGRGRLDGPGRVVVSTDAGGDRVELEAGHVVVGTGSRPRQLPDVATDGQQLLTSDDALFLDSVPPSAIVLGAGAVGVEFASFWRSAGSEVTLVEMAPRLVPLEDEAIGRELRKQFEARGIRCLVGMTLDPSTVERNEGGVSVMVRGEDGEQRLQATVLLVAIGRAGNVEDIGLEQEGVAVERGAITVDREQRSSAAGISAIGDVAGGFQLAHKAMHEGVIAVEAIAGRHPHGLDPRLVTRTTYCTPQIASVGLSEAEAREAGHDVSVGVFPFRGNARAVVWGETGGFTKVVADTATNSVLGVHIIGHEVTELIYGPALGALLESTPFEMSRAVASHPTLSESLAEAALAVSGEALHI
ncbi:MAG: dihydrolipoyl dehydrogenase [Candidatus Dormibacteraeota bacterium]|uniref:Dihydrolipoyl dehydrogenase n=1 Tax=Candidatus Aeolococcus gillhamiae TaxID=3127015 RepID=A0A2W5Z1N1_9BACT|nr:dihydrolipoyl dehydrogenase [Candidatus Dormibacteraeota bacterium]PZR78037.1 MAG: dihydrolipoyl dehydrogenase [Candidatus Dormibacter sp. RRmetagenome_bin12]